MLNTLKSKHFFKRIFIFFAIMGPGIITANVDNDAGGITTYSLAGANYGYLLLWSLIPITIFLIITQEMCNRMGVVTGKGLSDLIREKFGIKITFYTMLLVLITNFGNIVAEFAGIASSMELFGVSRYLSVPVGAFLVWYLIVKGTYKSVQKIFLFACIFYISYIISGILIKPNWLTIFSEIKSPKIRFDTNYLIIFTGLIGTTIAPWMQFYQQASIAEKGIKLKDYKYSRLDTIFGCITVNIVAFFIMVVCGTILFKNVGTEPIQTAADAARALQPLAGEYCSLLFAFGLLNASLFAASILPLSTTFTICESFGWETGVNKKFSEAPQFYSLYTVLILIGAATILIPGIPLIKIMFLSQVVNGLVLPIILVLMLTLVNDKKIMGEYINSKLLNVSSWILTILMIIISIYTLISIIK